MKVMVLNDHETYTDLNGCYVLDATPRQIEAVLDEGREAEYEKVGEVTIPLFKVKKLVRS